MEKLIELINEKTENNYNFLLKSALYQKSADFCKIEIFYKDGTILTKEIKDMLLSEIFAVLPTGLKYDISFIKNFISEERIASEIKIFMSHNFPSISNKIESVKLENNTFFIVLLVEKLAFEHAKNNELATKIEQYFKRTYENYEYKCEMVAAEVFVEDELEILKKNYREEDVDFFEKRIIEVTNVLPLVGDEISEPASYIKDKTEVMPGVVLCGRVSGIKVKEITIERKKNDKKKNEEEKQENDGGTPKVTEYKKKLFTFFLSDFTGDIKCRIMSNKQSQAKIEKLDEASEIIVRGDLEKNKFNDELEMRIRDLAYCSVPKGLTEYIEYKKEKPFYEWVTPEKMTVYKQNDLLSFEKEEIVPEFLKNKTFVCFDFETTGLHFAQGDKIIEIGAIKIENGKITEKFMSYVNPEKPIPAESSAISGIVDSDVAGAPKDYQVLQDFYKFTRGAIIIGYNNINFDNVFLIGQGKQCRWNFDNETADVYKYATKYVHGVKNYKLGTIADKLGVVLDNAHRAVFDALATAEIFLKIAAENDLSMFK